MGFWRTIRNVAHRFDKIGAFLSGVGDVSGSGPPDREQPAYLRIPLA
jgi:hypothetical protein